MKAMEPDHIISFGYWTQQRRLALDLTRPALARRINCSPVTIKKIERDERRPSRQIAALLAEHLLIPEQDRDAFIRMARGEFVVTSPAASDVAVLSPFLRSLAENAESEPPLVVARERQLARLTAHLDAALAGNGGIVFITGEAGDGKTELAQAFLRQCQMQNPNLVAAYDNCNAYTGIGDPYLPFREILELLTGDIASRWVGGSAGAVYAGRLWRSFPYTVQALLEVGRDLVGTLLSDAPLITRATATGAELSQPILDQLRALVDHHQARLAAGSLHRTNLISQYAKVLQRLARRQPLLLIVDDLQWVDTGSISLLFHLGRHLQGQRILLIGIYRAAEVALGRGGVRHPLEPLLNEMQQTFGDMHIRLNQTDGRHFVDALIDSEPNRLGQSFRDTLYKQTGGHPLFTAEMLAGLRLRGDLVQNEDGEWVESPALAWKILPARVEGVIRERIGRLPLPLQEFLQIASVAGETFCAEIVAHVQGIDERRMAGQLGAVLDRQQHLVIAQGIQQIGARQFSHYRFRHILFQQYLYNNLEEIQRVYLHRAMADELVKCYGEQVNLMAPQMARHYAIAGDNLRALHYLTVAGDMAANIYANTEADGYYRRALDIVAAMPPGFDQTFPVRQVSHLFSRFGRTMELDAHYDQAIDLYESMESTGRKHSDDGMVLASLLARSTIRTTVNFARDPEEGQRLLQEARTLAREMGDRGAEAKILWNLLILSAYTGGDLQQRLLYGEQALALVRTLDLPEQLAFTLHDIFYAYAGAGQWQRARARLYEARDLWQSLGNLPMLSETLMRLHWTYLVTGEYEQATAYAEEAHRLGQESHNIDAEALSHFMLGFVYWERGEIGQALTTMEEDIAIAASVNSLTPLVGTRADLGLLYGELDAVDHGLALADLARTVAEEQLPILRFWPHAIQVSLQLCKGNVAAAEELIATLADYRTVKTRFGYMPFMWVRVGLAHGEFALHQGALDRTVTLMDALYADLCAADIWYLRADVLHLKGRALMGQGIDYDKEARVALEQAQAAATKLGSRRALWPTLVSLAELACRRGDGAAATLLHQEAREIVEKIADHIGTPTLRSAFLGLPQVRALRLSE